MKLRPEDNQEPDKETLTDIRARVRGSAVLRRPETAIYMLPTHRSQLRDFHAGVLLVKLPLHMRGSYDLESNVVLFQ